MVVTKRFKTTNIGAIPEDWDVATFGDVAEPDPEALSSKTQPYFRFNYVALEDVSRGKLVGSSEQVFATAPVRARRVIRRGDILIGTVRPNLQSHLLFQGGSGNWICSTGFCVLRPKQKRANSKYLFAHLFTSAVSKQIEATIAGSSYPAITQRDIRGLEIPVPPTIEEQAAIAKALADADGLIETLEQLIAKKLDIKQAAMQQLLTGKTRLSGFTGAWRSVKLGTLGAFLKGSGVSKAQAHSGLLPCVRYGELYTLHDNVIRRFGSGISAEVAQSALQLQIGDVLFAGSGETKEEIGKCAALVDRVQAYAGGDIIVLRGSSECPAFLGYYLNCPQIQAQKASKGQGDAVVHISAKALGDIECSLPELSEQEAIAGVLLDMDRETGSLTMRLRKTREVKQGMMQQLLTGKVRLV
ncbi:MAG TPA: restriction endonuclease subunit S [Fimbriimonadaceae bacterium]|nr:restriction endonuclease subunit S [Fimbriimonadaceae bacterium]